MTLIETVNAIFQMEIHTIISVDFNGEFEISKEGLDWGTISFGPNGEFSNSDYDFILKRLENLRDA